MKYFLLFSALVIHFSLIAQLPKEGWSFSYPGDNFTKNALLDLRYLNENIAGENGFIQLSSDGNSFQTENGKPIRFWSINGGDGTKNMNDADLARFARFLAKMGVNMIRYHGSINPSGAGSKITDIDKADVNAIWRMVAAMKKEGIYSTISPFWAHNGHMGGNIPTAWGVPGYSGSTDFWEVMYFSDTLKNAYKIWVNHLYTEKNPFTGIALKDDPAVGLIQIKNEDGVFWWTISSVKPELAKIIRKKFYQWAISKYGTFAAVKSAWLNITLNADSQTEGEFELYHIWDATQPQSGGKAKRLSDQIQFLTETQRNFYTEIREYYRSLGCKQLVNANNWKTASSTLLFDAERYTNTACEVIAVNRYFDPGHTGGPNVGWRIDPGDYYTGKSVLFEPHNLPVNIKQVKGHPALVTESGWNLPHKYQAEGPFLVSAYMSLTGVDSYYWFSPSSSSFDPNPYHTWTNLAGGQHPMNRWTCSTPGQLAMFPANALLFRKGYISQGETMVHEERTLQSIYDRKMPQISEENSFDPNRDSYSQPNPSSETPVSPLAHLAGKAEVVYGGNPSNTVVSSNIEKLINYKDKIIKAGNNQLTWDYKNGICTMDAPFAQGVCGFLKPGKLFSLSDVTIESTNDYAVVNVVSMDDKKISESAKILVQVGTVYQPTNWSETPSTFTLNSQSVTGFKIENTGKMPWKCANTKVILRINNSSLTYATQLDAAGYAKKTLALTRDGNKVILSLPDDAMYVVLESVTKTQINKTKDSGLKISPNPSKESFRVEINRTIENQKYDFEIIGLTGQKIFEKTNISDSSFEVSPCDKANGIYLAVLRNKNLIIGIEKICIQNN